MIDKNEFWSKYKSFEVYDVSDIPNEIQKSIQLAKAESKKAYAPYSSYGVGAVIVTETGREIASSNSETCNYDVICAEAGAISQWTQIQNKTKREEITYVVVAGNLLEKEGSTLRSDIFITPCGRCRQRLYEHCKNDTIILSCNETLDKVRVFKLCDLLPYAFSPRNLK